MPTVDPDAKLLLQLIVDPSGGPNPDDHGAGPDIVTGFARQDDGQELVPGHG